MPIYFSNRDEPKLQQPQKGKENAMQALQDDYFAAYGNSQRGMACRAYPESIPVK
jgi:hypothetical protein